MSSKDRKKNDVIVFVRYPSETLPMGTPRYRDPKNPLATWSGKGRKPKWLLEYLKEGKTLEDFAIRGDEK